MNRHIPVHQIGETKPQRIPVHFSSLRVILHHSIQVFSTRKAGIPFFLEVLAWNSFSSTLTEILLYFMRQKKERRAPEHNRVSPTGRSVWTCTPAGDMKG